MTNWKYIAWIKTIIMQKRFRGAFKYEIWNTYLDSFFFYS